MSEQENIMEMNTQLAIYMSGILIPIHGFRRSIRTPEQRIHHLHKSNNGTFSQPTEIDFSFQLYEIGKDKEALTVILFQLNRTFFDIVLAEYNGNEWTFNSLGFDKCKIVNSNSDYSRERPPEDRIDAICLAFNVNNAVSFGST